ncbi:MAG: hypothetical protein KC621_14780 [Myxococcales bacterium]|nr:hypothetical protein [Myxococcales bacterium]
MSQKTYLVEGRAARWLRLLQDFGHLDADGQDRLLVAVAELAAESGHPPDLPVGLDLVRRAAAILLLPDDLPMSQILEEDWPLLFS